MGTMELQKDPATIRLYHGVTICNAAKTHDQMFTLEELEKSIMEKGLLPGQDGYVWFVPAEMIQRASASDLLVWVDIPLDTPNLEKVETDDQSNCYRLQGSVSIAGRGGICDPHEAINYISARQGKTSSYSI